MSNLLHLKDPFGNDMFFGNTGHIRVAAMPDVNYSTLLSNVSDVILRPDDVIVVGYPKSGNNWTHHMVSMLVAGSTQLPPMVEKDDFIFLDGLGDDRHPPPPTSPRVFLSHLPFRFLPRDVVRQKVKVVYVTRNPKDAFVSLFCHVISVKPPIGYQGTWAQFFSVMLEQGYWYGEVWQYLRQWQTDMEQHPLHPFFHCNYEETKQDTLAQVERLNQFLGTGRERQLCEDIVRTCDITNMHVTRPISEEALRHVFLFKEQATAQTFYRKGEVGDWKNWFTEEQNAQFDDVYTAKMADYKYNFRYE